MSSSLVGRRARRIDMPDKELLAITLAGEAGTVTLVYRISGTPRGGGLVEDRPRGAPADGFTRRLRKLLEGAVVEGVGAGPHQRLVVRLRRSDGSRTLVLDADPKARHLWVVDGDGKLEAALDGRTSGIKIGAEVPAEWLAAEAEVDDAALRASGPALVARGTDLALDERRRRLERVLRAAEKRLDKRLDKIAADASRAVEVDPLRARASLILSHLHAWEAGSDRLRVVDYATDPPTESFVEIDPAVGPKGQADALFHRARRLARGVEKAAERRATTERELAVLRALRARLDAADDDDAFDAVADEAARAGVRGARATAPKGRRAPKTAETTRRPYRRFNGHGGRPILVGRGAADNDALTLRHARPSDLWLHARGHRGAHVIVPLARGEECPGELLLDAAALAVHFSAAAGEDRIEVQHTPRRYVRKPRGAAPGAVLVDRERVVVLRHEPERIARLLANEEHG